jgi:hypothetical protein
VGQVAVIELRRKFDGADVEVHNGCLCLGAPGDLISGEETVLHGLDVFGQQRAFREKKEDERARSSCAGPPLADLAVRRLEQPGPCRSMARR